jgi:N-acetylglucosaminyldiphosphoundecaprenol N-acetyl-beta-D-mannosaminyltransferase
MESLPLRHLKITPGNLSAFLAFAASSIEFRQKAYCIPIHLTKYVVSKSDPKLRRVINAADIVIADGVPISWLSWRLGHWRVRRVTGIELAEAILTQSSARGWRVFLLGGRPDTLERALANVRRRFGGPRIVGVQHGYFRANDVDGVVANINAARPDVLLLGMGMPQKEYFIYDHYQNIQSTFWLPVGGAFDVWAQTKKRANPWVQRLGLEWLQRSVYDRRKAKNIARYGFEFMKDFFVFGA